MQIASGLPEYFAGVKAGADEINDEIDQLNESLNEADAASINKNILSQMRTTGVSLKFSSDMAAMEKRAELVDTLRGLLSTGE